MCKGREIVSERRECKGRELEGRESVGGFRVCESVNREL